ncbi:glycosyltransferase [Caldanaerobacter subterraneus]|uniref:Glycosyltransferase n=1 Tax=Caldanaerobacter subterraneus TaxID=911092 RepID=A0A7Y2L8U3_9THEO|nr:glycosyltransferase [Caldanaerobacter subterraneus]NNG67949.1 glycosyltransferase [Caldanaerobacter subterraneus]
MKMLFITPQPPENYGGGGMVINGHLRALESLLGNKNIIYIGPQSNTVDLSKYYKIWITEKAGLINKVAAAIFQNTFTGTEIYLLRHQKELSSFLEEADFVWVETTKLGTILQLIKSRFSLPIYCFSHNDEIAYYMQSEPHIYKIFKKAIFNSEKLTAEYADIILFGSEISLKTFQKKFKVSSAKLNILNMFTHIPRQELNSTTNNNYIKGVAFSGSFKYLHNMRSLLKIINIWRENNFDYMLVIIGSGFLSKRTNLLTLKNIAIVNQPVDEINILKFLPIYVNPVVSYGGILIKNLVALSAGNIVIGFKDTFRGYLEGSYFIPANDLREMFEIANKLLSEEGFVKSTRQKAVKYFNESHSLEYGISEIAKIIRI